MSRKHIQFIPAVGDVWLAYRENGIGGSEMGAILGQADYTDPIKVYLEKIGEPVSGFQGNRFSRFGKLLEPTICDLYQYWDPAGDAELMLINKEEKTKHRKVKRVNGFIFNTKYPWLFASIDRQIMKDLDGEEPLHPRI
jgi:predicted phage-related endonuclease